MVHLGRGTRLAMPHRGMLRRTATRHGAVVHAAIPYPSSSPAARGRSAGTGAAIPIQGRAYPAPCRSIPGLGDQRIGTLLARRDDQVIGLGHRDLEFVDRHRPDILSSACTTVSGRPVCEY